MSDLDNELLKVKDFKKLEEKCKDCGWLSYELNTNKPIGCSINIDPKKCNDVLILNKTMIRRKVKKK